MTASLQRFEAMLNLPSMVTFIDDEEPVELRLDPKTYVGTNGSAVRCWLSKDGHIKMALAVNDTSSHTFRMLIIASSEGIFTPDVADALADLFMPDNMAPDIEFKPYCAGQPPAMVITNHYSLVTPATWRPSEN